MAVNIILRHEVTGQPPADLIHLLSGGRRLHLNGSSSLHLGRRHSYGQTDPRSLQSAGLCGGGGLYRNRSEGAVTASDFAPPPSNNLVIEREGSEHPVSSGRYRNPLGEEQRNNGPSSADERYAFSGGAYDRFPEELQTTGMTRCPLSKNGQPILPPAASVVNSTPQQDVSQNFRQRHIEEADAGASEDSKHQQILNMQSGIEASLKETKKTSETDTEIDSEAMSYAAKVSKETFDEEYRKEEARKALEKRMVDISLAVSLSDPVKKSEEELIGEALKKSLADPIPKSEVQLFEQARENSLEDIERLEVIMKSEEELVEVAKQKSLHTLSKDEELIYAVKRQSLKDAHKDPLSRALEESLSESLEFDTRRRLTSSTHLMSFGEDGNSDCSSCVEHHLMPSRFDSPLKRSDLDLTDRKMPALDLPTAQNCEEDQAQHNNRLRSTSDCSSSVDLLDRKMPAVVLPASQNGDVISSLTFSHHSDCLSSSDLVREYDNRSAASTSVDQHSKDSRNSKVRCLSVDGASLSLINGVYKEEVNKSNMFTLCVGLNDGIGTVASIYQTTSTQGKKEWVISLFNSNFPPDTELGTDVILYTASVDNFNEELPSPSTNWVSTNAMVLTGSPPRVAEL